MMKIESNKSDNGYFDYIERVDEAFDIEFEVNNEYVVNSKASIKITFTSKKKIKEKMDTSLQALQSKFPISTSFNPDCSNLNTF